MPGTQVFCDDGDGSPFHIAEEMDQFRPWFNTAKQEGVPSIEVHMFGSGKPFELVTDHIVAFAPMDNQKQDEPDAFAERRSQPCICGHQRQVHRDGGRCQYSPDIGTQCGCEGFEAQ